MRDNLAMLTALVVSLGVGAVPADVVLERTVPAPVATVFSALTTVDGAKSFFAPDARIEPKVGGAYELYFAPDAPLGSKGSDGCQVIALEPDHQLVVSWNFPPSLAVLRASKAHTVVTFEFSETKDHQTKLRLTQSGWKDTPDFHQGRDYFAKAWNVVLSRLEHRFRVRPIDWKAPWAVTPPEALSFLNGTWRLKDGSYEEVWSAHPAGLVGMSRSFKNGRPNFYELSTVEREGDELVLSVRMFTPGLANAAKTEAKPLRLHLRFSQDLVAHFVSEGGDGVEVSYRLGRGVRAPDRLDVRVQRPGQPDEVYDFERAPPSPGLPKTTSN